jgi:hypothetical protein
VITIVNYNCTTSIVQATGVSVMNSLFSSSMMLPFVSWSVCYWLVEIFVKGLGLTANIRLTCKSVPWTNTLAYFTAASVPQKTVLKHWFQVSVLSLFSLSLILRSKFECLSCQF